MNKTLLKEGIKEIIANNGSLIIDYANKAIELWIKLQQENFPTHYSVVYTDDDYTSEYKMFIPLTSEQINEIKQAAIIDGEECDYDDVLEQFADRDFLHVDGPCGDLTPSQIDLDHKYYLYSIDVAVFINGLNNPPKILKRKIELNNEEYIWLMYRYMIYPETSFNEIRNLNPKLFNKMCGDIEANIEDGVVQYSTPAYTADLTQIKEDAAELKKNIDEVKSNIYRYE